MCCLPLLAPTKSLARGEQFAGSRAVYLDASGRHSELSDVALDGSLHSNYVASWTEGPSDHTYKVYEARHLIERHKQAPEVRVLARWTSKDKGPHGFDMHATRASRDGGCYALASETNNNKANLVVLREGIVQSTLDSGILPLLDAHLLLDERDQPVAFYRAPLSFEIRSAAPGIEPATLVSRSDYDWSVATDGKGIFYLASFDSRSRDLVVTQRGQDGVWKRFVADVRESGWQHSISMYNGRAYVAYYYFRNSFNKGLRVLELHADGTRRLVTLIREQDGNRGWKPQLEIDSTGHVRLSHEAEHDGRREQLDFASPSAMMSAREPDGSHDWRDESRDLTLFVGAMGAYQFWLARAPRPSASEAAVRPSTAYHLDPALVWGGTFQLRYRQLDVGGWYTRSLMGQQIKDMLGPNGVQQVQSLLGWINWSELLFGHDVRITGAFTDARGYVNTDTTTEPIHTEVIDVESKLINLWRINYGVRFRQYALPQPVYVYEAAAKAVEYKFIDGGLVDAATRRGLVFVGYSRLDFMEKYRVQFTGLDLDLQIGVGMAKVRWSTGVTRTDSAIAFASSARTRLGYLYYRRFLAVRGAGVFLRLGYESTFDGTGARNGAPDDRRAKDKDFDKPDLARRVALHQLQHGPYLGLGFLY